MESADVEQINLLPGFSVVEYTPRSTTLDIPSGFRICVTRAGPYLYEALDDGSLKDPGPFTIKIHLMKEVDPPGVIVDHIYEPPVDDDGNTYCPDQDEHPKAYAYYQAWRLHNIRRQQRLVELASKRKDLALVNCVRVISGPVCFDDDGWMEPISALVPIPDDRPSRYLLFLKTQVVSTEATRDVLTFLWNVEEVTIEGLKRAFDTFRRSIPWESSIKIV